MWSVPATSRPSPAGSRSSPEPHSVAPALVLDPVEPAWTAHFAWSEDRGGPGLSVRYFRRVFELDRVPASVRVHLTADTRYRLWLNGRRLGFGPAKRTLRRYHYDTYELAGGLRPGRNVLAAEVRWFGENAPLSEVQSPVPGWLVQGPAGLGIDTPDGWRVWIDRSVTPDTTSYLDNAQTFLNHLERVDTRRQPAGWREVDFDDGAWPRAVSTGPAAATSATWGVRAMRTLLPRDVPAMAETDGRFVRSIRDHRVVEHVFDERPAGWTIRAGEGARLLLDAGHYVTAFPVIDCEGGYGRELRVLYAEALGRWETTNGRREWVKAGVRDNVATDVPHGYRDTLTLDDRRLQWEPFYWRAFRWIELEVLPGPATLTVRDVRFRRCVHPQRFAAAIETSDPEARRIFEVSVRTFQTGAHEIYDDSPYFEQFSYIADARLEALGSLHLCNDASLPRRTLLLYLDTLRGDGLIDARVPCQYARQTIPYFCLHWIFMVHDYWRWMGAPEATLVRQCLPAVDTILMFFRSRLRPDGFVGPTGGWNMVDAAEEWPNGQPAAVAAGGSTYLTCLLVEALEVAARLHREAGHPEDAPRWESLAEQLRRRVRASAWDSSAGLFVEGVDHRTARPSQHTQAAAINAGVATREQTDAILTRLCTDATLIRCKSMQSFYLARALERAGRFDLWHRQALSDWRRALSYNVTTWPEYPDPSRSDSHAWAAWPAVDYVTTVLGLRPGAPGWAQIRLQPQFDGLDWARGEAPTPQGVIRVAWARTDRGWDYEADTPSGVPVEVMLPGREPQRFERGGPVRLHLPRPA